MRLKERLELKSAFERSSSAMRVCESVEKCCFKRRNRSMDVVFDRSILDVQGIFGENGAIKLKAPWPCMACEKGF